MTITELRVRLTASAHQRTFPPTHMYLRRVSVRERAHDRILVAARNIAIGGTFSGQNKPARLDADGTSMWRRLGRRIGARIVMGATCRNGIASLQYRTARVDVKRHPFFATLMYGMCRSHSRDPKHALRQWVTSCHGGGSPTWWRDKGG
jgi:hypothetical protein